MTTTELHTLGSASCGWVRDWTSAESWVCRVTLINNTHETVTQTIEIKGGVTKGSRRLVQNANNINTQTMERTWGVFALPTNGPVFESGQLAEGGGGHKARVRLL